MIYFHLDCKIWWLSNNLNFNQANKLLMDINPKQFAKNISKDESPFIANRDEFGKDDDDPLSIKDASLTLIGFILAVMTLFLPAFSVFFERPFLHQTVFYNDMVKKDGY